MKNSLNFLERFILRYLVPRNSVLKINKHWLLGVKAQVELNWLLSQHKSNWWISQTSGYYFNDGKWVVFDNSTGDCWVEEFNTEVQCIKYLNGVDHGEI